MKGYIYCTKITPYLLCEPYMDKNKPCRLLRKGLDKTIYNCAKENAVNGKVVAEVDFEVEEITYELYGDLDWQHDYLPTTNTMSIIDLERESCLDRDEIKKYLQGKNGYAIHIKNLHIFNKPRELSDFNKIIETPYCEEPDAIITKAPQNMMRCCYEKKPKEWETGVLISIRPEWVYKILNGEKTIEVRKVILNEIKKLVLHII